MLLRRAARNCDCDSDLTDEAPCLVVDVAANSTGADPFNDPEIRKRLQGLSQFGDFDSKACIDLAPPARRFWLSRGSNGLARKSILDTAKLEAMMAEKRSVRGRSLVVDA